MAQSKKSNVKKSALLKATEKQIKSVAREIKSTGRLRSAHTGRFIKATTRNATHKAIAQAQRQLEKTGKSVVKDTRQIKKTTNAAIKLIKQILPISKPKNKYKVPPTPKNKIPPPAQPAQTRRKAPTPKPPKKITPKKPPAYTGRASRIYELVDLPESFNNATLNATLEELQENADGYDSFLRPGEGWGFRFGTGLSYKFYETFDLAISDMQKYITVQTYGDNPFAYDDLVDLIKIIRFKAPGKKPTFEKSAAAWNVRKQAEVSARAEKQHQRELKKREREKTITAQKKKIEKLERELQEKVFEVAREKARNRKTNSGGKKK